MKPKDHTIFFSMGKISVWRVFRYDFRPVRAFRDENVRGYLKLVGWITFLCCAPVIIYGLIIDLNYIPQKIYIHFVLLMPAITLALICSYILPVKQLYWMIILVVLGASISAIHSSLLGGGIYAPVLLPVAALILVSVAFASPFFPITALVGTITLWLSLFLAHEFLFPDNDDIRVGWTMFNILFGIAIVVLLGIRTLLKDMAVALRLQEEQIDHLTQTNALLNITLSHNDFGLAGFNLDGKLVMQRGATLQRLLPADIDEEIFKELNKFKQKLQDYFDISTFKNDYVEIEMSQRFFVLRAYDIKSMTIISHLEVTHIRKVEAELRARQKLSVIGEITSGVAHNYNNALAIALSNLEAIPLDKNEPIMREYIEPSIRAIESSSDISHKLLALAGRQNLKLEVFDVRQTLENMNNLIRSAIGTDIILKINCEPSLKIETDLAEFETAILNLLINAGNAIIGHDGRIDIKARRVENRVMVSIHDNGHGIKKEIAHKIFDPFFSTNATKYSTGLGLSTVKGFVEQSKGEVKMRSSTSGTVFELYFPLAKKSNIQRPCRPQLPLLQKGLSQGNQVLIVDDNEQVLQSFERLLKALGLNVVTCASPRKSIELFQKKPDIRFAFVDLTMPEMNGIELGKELQNLRPDIQLYLITGETHAEHYEEAYQAGFQEVILKPVRAQHLISLMTDQIEEKIA